MNLEKTVRELTTDRFSFFESDEWALNQQHPQDWSDFTASWDRLVTDHYMKEGDSFRERRFCKFRVDTMAMSFQELDDFVFYQTTAINKYAGGLRREFAPVEAGIRQSRILLEIIRTCLRAILACDKPPTRFWKVYVHQFRINCHDDVNGLPTPEGVHSDGHDFISMHLMDRCCIEGGKSVICDKEGRSLMEVTLKNRMDGFLIDDQAVFHGVSPIAPVLAKAGHRDMLIIDYNRDKQQ